MGARVALTGTVKGSGAVTKFGNAAQVHTTATLNAPGHYILALSVADNVHAVTYDAVAIDVLR